MSGQQAFFTSDTALLREPRTAIPSVTTLATPPATKQATRTTERSDSPRKTLAERLIAAWLAPWTHGFTPLW